MKNEIYQSLYKRDKPMPMKIMGIIVALFSIGGLAYSTLFSVLLALVAGGIIAYYNGIELNYSDKTYRMITALGTKGFGEWEPLPALKCVSVFKTNLVSSTYGRSSASITTKQTVVQVNLITENDKRIRVFETEDTDKAFSMAKDIAQKLNLKIWNATDKPGHWVE